MEDGKNTQNGDTPQTESKPLNTAPAPKGLDLGLFINGQYVTVKQIGKGGFGTVWQAYDFSLRNFVAIKELLKEYSENKFVEMFYKEALMAKNIIHDNIVRVQHFWNGTNGSYYIVMDFVNGVDLEGLLKKCNELNIKIPWEISTLIAINVLKAIDYANRIARDSITGRPYGIVYRDISPGNVLLSFDGNVKLSDFGIAKTADDLNNSVKQNVVTGKYPYMSPEQIKGSADIDHRADIFSIGVVLYEMFTGQALYSGDNDKIRSQVLNQKFDLKSLDGLNLPYEMPEVLAKSLEKDRENRYERAIEMYRDLRRLIKGYETEELSVELASFLGRVMKAEADAAENTVTLVKALDRNEIKNNTRIPKIICKDFIVGESPEAQTAQIPAQETAGVQVPPPQGAGTIPAQNTYQESAAAVPQAQAQQASAPQVSVNAQPPLAAEAKGKTVFEEVGDWLITKFRDIKKKTVRIAVALMLAAVIFAGIDVFAQLTPFGTNIYARIYPPDAVITTIPAGAIVSMKTKEGDVILANANSYMPIPVRKVQPGTYIVTALKEGFRPVQRIVKIEERTRGSRIKNEKIEIQFDFLLDVNSVPSGADVYIDGNKFGVTPCRVQLVAGEHTVMLALEGYEDLGSKAKETREGQANIDFSRSTMEEMFLGVDKNFWAYELKNIDGENVFSITGNMFKKFSITSSPANMIVHVQGEAQPRGNTPLNTSFKTGTYDVRLLDPNGRYGEVLKTIKIGAGETDKLFVHMNRFITFRVRSKAEPSAAFMADLKITGKEYSVTRQISTGKPLRLAIPSGTYDIVFSANSGEFKNFVMKNVNINDVNNITGDLEYAPGTMQFEIVNKATGAALDGAFIWIDNKLAGKTDKKGVWSKTGVSAGAVSGKIVAKDFIEMPFEKQIQPGKTNKIKIEIEPVGAPAPALPAVLPTASSTTTAAVPKAPVSKPAPAPKAEKPKTEKPKEPSAPQEQQVIVCKYCGYVNTAPPGKRLRFCVNCAKPLR
jgi:serine/threonine-protein kinase